MFTAIKSHQPFFKKYEILSAIGLAFMRLKPRYLIKNPVIFVAYIGCLLITFIYGYQIFYPTHEPDHFILQIALWLWFTVLFSNFSEALAEGKGKAQASLLRKNRQEITAKRIPSLTKKNYCLIPASELRYNDLVLVQAGDIIPGDGQVVEGIASIDESTVTGESAPVIRESGGDRDSVTAGTLVLSDWIIVKIMSNPGETFLDQMINLVEGAKRQKTPNEISLTILLSGTTLIFLVVTFTLLPFSFFTVKSLGEDHVISMTVLISLLVCLIPTTIGGLLSAIGIAGINRLIRANVITTSGRAVEAAGDITVLLLDKTGTITMGNRQAIAFYPATNVTLQELAQAAELSSLADTTPEGKSILALARNEYKIKPTDPHSLQATFIPFSAQYRISGIEINNQKILKGASDSIMEHLNEVKGVIDNKLQSKVQEIARKGNTPLLIADNQKVLGAIELKDIIKSGIKERLAQLRIMGIKSIMITGDNPLTTATIAAEAGVDDYYAQATPEIKLNLIKQYQAQGQLVAMAGDGTNDAPALAQTDVAVVMNSGTQAAKEAANMIDLDSDPTKIIEIVKIGKQLLITRGALTTFSLSNDIAKYFAIIPAAFTASIPALDVFNIMHLGSPYSAILSAVIFNALSIIFLIPLALKGVRYQPRSASYLLMRHSFVYALGGIIVPFIGIKLIDFVINLFNIV